MTVDCLAITVVAHGPSVDVQGMVWIVVPFFWQEGLSPRDAYGQGLTIASPVIVASRRKVDVGD